MRQGRGGGSRPPPPTKPRRFLRRQPRPFGAASANRDPHCVPVYVFLDRERARLRHRLIHFRNRIGLHIPQRPTPCAGSSAAATQSFKPSLHTRKVVKHPYNVFARFRRVTATK